jgi:hypothetical protein
MIECSLPKAEWTYEAHLHVGLWHALRYSDDIYPLLSETTTHREAVRNQRLQLSDQPGSRSRRGSRAAQRRCGPTAAGPGSRSRLWRRPIDHRCTARGDRQGESASDRAPCRLTFPEARRPSSGIRYFPRARDCLRLSGGRNFSTVYGGGCRFQSLQELLIISRHVSGVRLTPQRSTDSRRLMIPRPHRADPPALKRSRADEARPRCPGS